MLTNPNRALARSNSMQNLRTATLQTKKAISSKDDSFIPKKITENAFAASAPASHANRLQLAAGKFHNWMTKYKESITRHGYYDKPNEALVSFLNADSGFKYVKTYEDLCQLAVLVQSKGYKTTNPPCTPVEFSKAIERANPRSFGDSKPVIPAHVKLQVAADNFDNWMQHFQESHRESGDYDNNNKALVSFLSADSGFKYVKTYEDLCQLAVLVQSKVSETSKAS